MSEALQELESKLAAAFDADDWSLEVSGLSEVGADSGEIRQVNMDLVPLGGSRPNTSL